MNYYFADGEPLELTDEYVRHVILTLDNTDERIGPDTIHALAHEVLRLRAKLRAMEVQK